MVRTELRTAPQMGIHLAAKMANLYLPLEVSFPLRYRAISEETNNTSPLFLKFIQVLPDSSTLLFCCVAYPTVIEREKKREADGRQRRTREVRKQATPKFHFRFNDKRSSLSRGSSGSISSGFEAVESCKQIESAHEDESCDYIYRSIVE